MKQPHILLVQSDQHNPKVCGYAGDSWVQTPHLDRLAEEGVVFENCYCNSPLCVPSRSSMLAGRLPSGTGVYNNLQCLRSDHATFATCLSIAGYETVLCGRMHFTGYDQRHGFEKRLVGDLNPTFPRPQRQKKLYGILAGTPDQSRVAIDKAGAGSSAMLCYDRAVTNAACHHLKERTDERPLFMLVGYGNPHCPFIAPESLYRKYDKLLQGSAKIEREPLEKMHPAIRQFVELRGITNVTQEEFHRIRSAYYANVEYMDALIGEVIQCAKEQLGDDLVVIYLSDHGECLGSHGLFWKSNFYEEAVHVPLIVSAPSRFAAGARETNLTSLVDIAPTLCALANAPHLPKEDGSSLLPLLEGQTGGTQRTVISMLADIKGDPPAAMIRRGPYKLVKYCGIDEALLFDLEKDPQEKNNLALEEGSQEVLQKLLNELYQSWNEQEAMDALEQGKLQAQLLRNWTKAVNPAGIEEWQSNPDMNYLL